MNEGSVWPVEVDDYIEIYLGKDCSVQPLKGIKTDGGCYRVRNRNGSAIIKRAEPQECEFYNFCLTLLGGLQVHIPELYFSHRRNKDCWLVLEDIPQPLPRERWGADAGVLGVLHALHSQTASMAMPIEHCYTPRWDDCLTTRVHELYAQSPIGSTEPPLKELQQRAQAVFTEVCWLNGDTNPTNWGLRVNGTVVLFDWERVCTGSPAIDIAIAQPGCGSEDGLPELLAAKRYLDFHREPDLNENELARQIRLAKIWSVAEYLACNADKLQPDAVLRLLDSLGKVSNAISIGEN